ncbi:unnamed protein product [Closterium sp. NIES-64]|nr:unnamed protein product [Closterium sp. NIES-64]
MSLGTESEPSPLWLPASHPLSTHNPPSAVSAPPPAPPPFPPHLFAVLPCSSPSPPCFDLTLHPAAPLLTTLPCSPPMEAAVSPLLAHVPLSSLTSPSPRSRPPLLAHVPSLAHVPLSSLTSPSPRSRPPLLAHVPLSSLTPPPRSRPPLLAHVPLSSLTSPSPRSRPAHKIMSLRDTAVAGMLPLFLTALTQLTSLCATLHHAVPLSLPLCTSVRLSAPFLPFLYLLFHSISGSSGCSGGGAGGGGGSGVGNLEVEEGEEGDGENRGGSDLTYPKAPPPLPAHPPGGHPPSHQWVGGGAEAGEKGRGGRTRERWEKQGEGEKEGRQREGGNEVVLVYKWMERGSLQAALQPGATPLSLQQRVGIAVGVLRALKAVQSHGQVHGDLKPSNVLLGPSFEPRVGDWSVVRMGRRVHVSMGRRVHVRMGRRVHVSMGRRVHVSMGRRVHCGGVAAAAAHLPPPPPPHPACVPIPPASVGVLLLQLLTGWAGPFRDVDGQRTHIYHWTQQHLTAGDLSPLLDPLLPPPRPSPALLLPLFHLALACSSSFPSSRPTPTSALDAFRPFRSSLLDRVKSGDREGGECGEGGKGEGVERGKKGEGEGGKERGEWKRGEEEGRGEGEGGEKGEDVGECVRVESGGRRSGVSIEESSEGAGRWNGGSALGARLAMLGAVDSREYVV